MRVEIHTTCKDLDKRVPMLVAEALHFDWYIPKQKSILPYAHFYWNQLSNQATFMRVALLEGRFAGVLAAVQKGAPPYRYRLGKALRASLYKPCLSYVIDPGVNAYVDANQQMREEYDARYHTDGELSLLAVEPWARRRGVGSALLRSFEAEFLGAEFRLITDSGCDWQFYEACGFERICERQIELKTCEKARKMTCMMYRI